MSSPTVPGRPEVAPARHPFAFEQERCPDGKFKPKSGVCDTTTAAVDVRKQRRKAAIGDATDFVESPASKDYGENYDAWRSDLSSSESGAIKNWTGLDYRNIREAMLSGDESHEFAGAAADLTSALERAPKIEGEIFRGMALSKGEVEQIAKVGTRFESKAHTSWSGEEEIARAFLFDEDDEDKIPVLLVAEDGRGVDMRPLSEVAHEAEVLAPAGESYEVVGVEPFEVFEETGFRIVVRRAA